MFLERQTERGEESVSLFVGLRCCDESDFHSVDSRVLVDVHLREDDLLLETEGVVSSAVHLLSDSVEVSDSRERDADKPLKELVHLHVAKGGFHTDRHALTETEVGNVLSRSGEKSLLTNDLAEFLGCLLNELLVISGLADTLR